MIPQDYEILKDETEKGRYIPWKEKKLANIEYFELLHLLEYKKATRVKECAEVLEFKENRATGKRKLFKTWFCKSRLCPLCNWRRSMKHSYQSTRILKEVMKREPNARFLFLTLSDRNVFDGEELKKSLSDMTRAFSQRFMRRKKIDKNLIGFMRATEVTVNDIDNSYNQHIHVLMCVKSTYFKDSTNYISQQEYREMWQKSLKIDYLPYAHVKAVRSSKRHNKSLKGSVLEIAKYPVKDTDYRTDHIEKNLQRVEDLEVGLRGKRLISYGGLLKEIHNELKMQDLEDADLINIDDEEKETDENAYSVMARWNWERLNYFIKN